MSMPPFAGMRQMPLWPTTDSPKARATVGAKAATNCACATIGATAGTLACKVHDICVLVQGRLKAHKGVLGLKVDSTWNGSVGAAKQDQECSYRPHPGLGNYIGGEIWALISAQASAHVMQGSRHCRMNVTDLRIFPKARVLWNIMIIT
jgi:hypothetical protein